MKNAIILFTRIPLLGQTKSRLNNFMTPKEILHLTTYLLKQTIQAARGCHAQLFLAVTPFEQMAAWPEAIDVEGFIPLDQGQGDLGMRMHRAMTQVFAAGYEQVALVGSDLYGLATADFTQAFDALGAYEVVVKPTYDGGYGLIGLRQPDATLFDLTGYGGATVCDQLVAKLQAQAYHYHLLAPILDIDTRDDIAKALSGDMTATFYHQGVYNANFLIHQGQDLLRIAMDSQMHLTNQIAYEFHALEALAPSGVVPPVKKLETYAPLIDKGYLIESYLPGRPLVYETDMQIAAKLLARVHNVPVPSDHQLIEVTQPLLAMISECQTMFQVYLNWDQHDQQLASRLQSLLSQAAELGLTEQVQQPVIINTELNAGNFLINEGASSYIIDWEKPLIADKEQDLAHFLVPTTTRWKTNTFLETADILDFIEMYDAVAQQKVDRTLLNKYMLLTCCRGLTWCAMAKAQFESTGKPELDAPTYQTINLFLGDQFMRRIESYFARGGWV